MTDVTISIYTGKTGGSGRDLMSPMSLAAGLMIAPHLELKVPIL